MVSNNLMTLSDWLNYIETLNARKIELGLERVYAVASRLGSLHFDLSRFPAIQTTEAALSKDAKFASQLNSTKEDEENYNFKHLENNPLEDDKPPFKQQTNPEKPNCLVITVGGTNGKGSCVATLEAIYHNAGYRVGAYTSPHLLAFNERVRINAEPVSDHDLCHAFSRIEEVRARADIALTYFEFITLAALLLFSKAALDVMILEVGMGGRLDAVNIVEPDVSVVTNVSIDHTHWLGDSREAIGREKAGIFRKGHWAIYGDEDPPESLVNIAKEVGARFYCLRKDFDYVLEERTWDWRSGGVVDSCLRGNDEHFRSTSPRLRSTSGNDSRPYKNGSHVHKNTHPQEKVRSNKCNSDNGTHPMKTIYSNLPHPHLAIKNVATALMAVECLQTALPVSSAIIKKAIGTTSLPGRFQMISDPVCCILDVAHNPASAELLAKNLKEHSIPHRTLAVVGMLKDKDIKGTLTPLLGLVDEWHFASLSAPRTATASEIKIFLADLDENLCYYYDTIESAYLDALKSAQSQDRIVVFGSFYAVREVLPLLKGAYYGN